jgi:indolepyruvate ferredoxin oxidoreductase beta subunit
MDNIINIKMAGLGGQGIIKASDILAEVAFRAGNDVKKSELHGMSQRGGSVSSDVRFGPKVWSPMIPAGETDFLIITAPDQIENNLPALKPSGLLIRPDIVNENDLHNKKSLNVALLGALSAHLSIPEDTWLTTIRESFPDAFYADNEQAFRLGKKTIESGGSHHAN